jgi:hypothetical protein
MMGIIEAVVRQSDCLILPMSAASQAVIPGRRIATGSATTAAGPTRLPAGGNRIMPSIHRQRSEEA